MNHIHFFTICFSTLLFSCGEKHEKNNLHQRKSGLAALDKAMVQSNTISGFQEKLNFWNQQLSNDKYNDSVLLSKIHYNIAGVYYQQNTLDSVKWHMQQAWDLMKEQKGYEEEKVLLNAGEGNIANTEGRSQEANYFYNQAAQSLITDTSLKLTPKQKTVILLAAAQSDEEYNQIDKAIDRNHKALSILLNQLPDDIPMINRVYSQLALAYHTSGTHSDSVLKCIHKMEELYAGYPTEINPRFLYDRKVLYFSMVEKKDSLLFYQQKLLSVDNDIR